MGRQGRSVGATRLCANSFLLAARARVDDGWRVAGGWAAGMAITGVILWKATPSSSSEYAKNSKFQKLCNGENEHEHH